MSTATEEADRISSSLGGESTEDDKKPFLPRIITGGGGGGGDSKNQSRRRLVSKSVVGPSTPRHLKAVGREIEHAAKETYLITRLAFTLLRYLGVGYKWITRFLALTCYALLLMPGFLQVAYHYFFSRQVRRSIVYGDQPRNRLDLYLPTNTNGPKPVVIFVTGGAWIIGYKAWGSLLGLQLAERNVIVACLDYRNFPQGTISDMVKDTCQGISFVCNNIANYGGDPNRIYLMGQSAGAHISACALLELAVKESKKEKSMSLSVSQIQAYFGLSGGIMEGEKSLKLYSPEVRIQDPSIQHAVSLLPPIILFHGTADNSIPSEASQTFADALHRVGARAQLVLYDGKTHTDLFLQDPLRGGRDELFDNLIAVIQADDKEALDKDAISLLRRRLVPEFLLRMAREISPF
ncbi:isoprenylcysteine alpha-carbonyl methylesterase ICME isoform X2 [Ziziphus jujuba]|uniref:protein-S-isoprenylcysteine alpha-carbonyl methylesterase n=1 Tax=Ziziphus jujuba TaxID=326968 RepID=A0A6P6FPD3_ZIZJJ|nr:isoprenylcysteine alpha-carbonyl methylesterase ICME isoform X2 [Ziziphus jujuba]